ncbi:MAG: Mitochondrial intermediate peptidase [Icmadophila ericetorum]|nr:Mitochondrial intermediate peptidase [Icmadophila ericetorum]
MASKLLQQPWTCARCLLRQRASRRYLATAAVASKSPNAYSVAHGAPPLREDDELLRQIFDSKQVWSYFSKYKSTRSEARVGLFENHHLTSPGGFHIFALVTVKKCQKIVDRVLQISTIEGYKTIARDLDRLSDLLCRIIDLSDFVRATHPDSSVQDAAGQAHAFMFEYMNKLNTTPGLYEQLQKALAEPEVVKSWSREEKTVAEILMKDFAQSAIDLPESKRRRFVELSNKINQLGIEVVDYMEPARHFIELDSKKLRGMDPTLIKRATGKGSLGEVNLITTGPIAGNAIRHLEDEETRKMVYIANRTASRRQIQRLEEFLQQRAEIAKLSGFPSFASMTLTDKMAKSPEAVNRFLEALSTENSPRIKHEMAELLASKRASRGSMSTLEQINAWDREHYRAKLYSQKTSSCASRKPDFLSAYFSLGSVVQGLSRLFSRLYGISFVPKETPPGEIWHPDVRRLDVVDETNGRVAVLYCDLFAREGKNPNPAHFTLRCSRLITPEEIEEVRGAHPEGEKVSFAHLENDGMATSVHVDPKGPVFYRQLPTIALICDFPAPTSNTPTLLSYRDLSTLFHEMGHAVHSILGRTDLQTISGTRCATDFAELPSVLMEHFARDPDVLGLFARHWETGRPLPWDLVKEKVENDRRGQGTDIENQILMAGLDQALHSELPLNTGFSSTAVYHEMMRKWSPLVPDPPETSWQGFFGHLVGYGGVYYSYLFDRAIAGRVWERVFRGGRNGGGLDREAGERYKQEVLKWGGSRSGWECVGGVLGGEEGVLIKEGGPEAMERVGAWGVVDKSDSGV